MRILIISDTHRNNRNFDKVIAAVGQPDLFIHCGDISGSELYFQGALNCPTVMVAGNNDFLSPLNNEEIVPVMGHKILVTHGHQHAVSYNNLRIKAHAAERGADIVLFGHTHRPEKEYDDKLGMWLANPGSLSYPRQDNGYPSYMIMEIEDSGEIHFTINYLKNENLNLW